VAGHRHGACEGLTAPPSRSLRSLWGARSGYSGACGRLRGLRPCRSQRAPRFRLRHVAASGVDTRSTRPGVAPAVLAAPAACGLRLRCARPSRRPARGAGSGASFARASRSVSGWHGQPSSLGRRRAAHAAYARKNE